MKGKTTIQTKHADCFTSDTPVSPASFSSVFPFDEMVVAINSVYWTIISRSSAIVHDCERSISISAAIKPVNDSIFSATETIIRGTPAIIFAAQIIVSDMQIIVSVTATVISGEPQNPTNDRIADGSPEIIMCDLKTSIGRAEAIISVLQITISKPKAVISKCILVMDDPSTVILESQSVICIHEATISVVETIISATEIDFSKASTVISVFLTSFLAAAIVICAAEKTAAAVPAVPLVNNQICSRQPSASLGSEARQSKSDNGRARTKRVGTFVAVDYLCGTVGS